MHSAVLRNPSGYALEITKYRFVHLYGQIRRRHDLNNIYVLSFSDIHSYILSFCDTCSYILSFSDICYYIIAIYAHSTHHGVRLAPCIAYHHVGYLILP